MFADNVRAGQALYTWPVLALYDLAVLGINCRLLWRCPARYILDLYNRCVSDNHLDVGVGTGYFLGRCHFPIERPRLALVDLNPNSLRFAARRLARYQPEVLRANVLEPIPIDGPKFNSVALSGLLHCLPGTMASKAVVFDHVKALLNSSGIVFGATLLGDGAKQTWIAQRAMKHLNARRILSNEKDSLERLRVELTRRFSDVSLDTIGCMALFTGRT